MSRERISMRKLKEVLRLKYDAKLSNRQIAKSLNVSSSTISRYLEKIVEANISWPLPETMTESYLDSKLFKQNKSGTEQPENLMPDYAYVHQELKKKGVTKYLLWEEHQAKSPYRIYSYSHFCYHYRAWCKERKLSMRQQHLAGEKLFVDYSGVTVKLYDPEGRISANCQIFIAVLGASNYTYVEATLSQSLSDWINSHVNTFNYLGGVPEIIVPDNLKSGVSKSCRYEPDINPSYQQMAEHYGTVVIPARPYRPKDKAKAEVAVQIVERWILAKLRYKKFSSVAELNLSIKDLMEELNNKPLKKLPGSRKSTFIAIDKPQLKQLPEANYEFTAIKKSKVYPDYHVEVDNHFYSVPYKLVGKSVETHMTKKTVAVFYKGERVASHAICGKKGGHSTKLEHMPEHHKKYNQWTPEKFYIWAEEIGPATLVLIKKIFTSRNHSAQSYRSALGLFNLSKKYDTDRLENACGKALAIGAISRKSVASILDSGLDKIPIISSYDIFSKKHHKNIRGSQYYH